MMNSGMSSFGGMNPSQPMPSFQMAAHSSMGGAFNNMPIGAGGVGGYRGMTNDLAPMSQDGLALGKEKARIEKERKKAQKRMREAREKKMYEKRKKETVDKVQREVRE